MQGIGWDRQTGHVTHKRLIISRKLEFIQVCEIEYKLRKSQYWTVLPSKMAELAEFAEFGI